MSKLSWLRAPATNYLADSTAKNKIASIFGSGLFIVLAQFWHTETQSPETKSNKPQHGNRDARLKATDYLAGMQAAEITEAAA
jgi:hypothetical protein